MNQSNETADTFKDKYERLKESLKDEQMMEQSRSFSSSHHDDLHNDMSTIYGSVRSGPSLGRSGSVASLGSGLAQQAKTLVHQMNNLNCTGGSAMMSDLGGPVTSGDMPYDARSSARKNVLHHQHNMRTPSSTQSRGRSSSASRGRSASRSYRQYSKSPQRVDI